jgi:chemotaxis methyl-accepting protein methylase
MVNRLIDDKRRISCLDAACGSGEGSYELAEVLLECGCGPKNINITGVTINPLEVFAAAHACFPHNPSREQSYRKFVDTIGNGSSIPAIHFMTGDLLCWETPERYSLIICNGILGGPFLNSSCDIENVMQRLAASLEPDGVLLVADRFHGGWKKRITNQEMGRLLGKCSLEVVQVQEGIAGVLRQDQN